MKAQAGGKLVISGAYSVLRGAPALVAAVDRYVIAESDEPASYHAPEVAAALQLLAQKGGQLLQAPNYDARALRDACGSDGRKLGLGSSAAIVVASLGACIAAQDPELATPIHKLRKHVYPIALEGHRLAQGGGSGVDVAAATFGGIIRAQRSLPEAELEVTQAKLPDSIVVEAWAMPSSAVTSKFVERFNAFESRDPERFAEILEKARTGAEKASELTASHYQDRASQIQREKQALDFIASLRLQYEAFCELGNLAEMAIVLPAVEKLNHCLTSDELFIPSGAGGGDITLYFGLKPSPAHFRSSAAALQLELVPLQLGAPGLTLLTQP